jgi:hypothetical protein
MWADHTLTRAQESEHAQLAEERKALAQEKAKNDERTKALAQGASQLEVAFEELHRLSEDMRSRLAVTPMNLEAAALQLEWKTLDDERVALAKATRALEMAMDKLADAHAAMATAV